MCVYFLSVDTEELNTPPCLSYQEERPSNVFPASASGCGLAVAPHGPQGFFPAILIKAKKAAALESARKISITLLKTSMKERVWEKLLLSGRLSKPERSAFSVLGNHELI